LVSVNVPALITVLPVKLFVPPKSRLPEPALVMPKAPPMLPPMVSAFAKTVIVGVNEVNVTAPVPRFKSLPDPAKVKLLLTVIRLFVETVTGEALVLSRTALALLSTRFPVPIAEAVPLPPLLMSSVPASTSTLPLVVLKPDSASVPAAILVAPV